MEMEMIKQEVTQKLEAVWRLREKLKLDTNLLNMDVKDEWLKFGSFVSKAERSARELTQASKKNLDELIASFKRFREML